MICRPVLLLALLAVPCAAAQPAPASLTVVGEEGYIDLATSEQVLTGNARIRDQDVAIDADEIRYNDRTRVATATGGIVFTHEGLRLLADRLVYGAADGSFSAENVRLGNHPLFVEGATAFGNPTEITITEARVFYGEPGPWKPTFQAESIIYGPGRQVRSDRARVGVGRSPFLPLRKFEHDFTLPFALGMAAGAGFRASLGAFAEVEARLPVTPSLRLGASVGGYTRRGVMVGPSGAYSDPRRSGRLEGFFRGGYIEDEGERGTDILGHPVPKDRSYFEWQHTQRLSERLTLQAQVNWWRDSAVLRDFRPQEFLPVQEPDTFVESVYTGRNYFLSAFTRLQPNTYQRVQERLPEIRFDLLPLAIGGGFYKRFNASVAVLREDPPEGGPRLRSDRFDAYYGLMRPISPREWAVITPVAGTRATHYANTTGTSRSGHYTRLRGEIGFDAEMRTSGVFAYRNERWKIDGLRHLLTPRIGYRYQPRVESGQTRIPRIDREVFSTYLPPLGLGDIRHLDDLPATNTLRLSFDNLLQTRDAVNGSRDLLALNVANDFRFRRRPGERDVSEVHAELAFMPAHWVQLDLYTSIVPQSFALREFNSGLTLRDGQSWSLRLGNNFLRGELQDYVVDGRRRINEVFDGLARLHYDARRRRLTEQAYGIVHNLGNTWLIAYTVNLYSGRQRESSFGFNVRIDTVRF